MTCIGDIVTKIVVLPNVGKEPNMITLPPDENVDLETVGNFLMRNSQNGPDQIWWMRKIWKSSSLDLYCRRITAQGRPSLSGHHFERDRPDFSGMSGRELFLSQVIHNSFVETNEEGKEATFATAAIWCLDVQESSTRSVLTTPSFSIFSTAKPMVFCSVADSPPLSRWPALHVASLLCPNDPLFLWHFTICLKSKITYPKIKALIVKSLPK